MPGWIYSKVRLAHRHHQKYLQTGWDGWRARLNQRNRSSLHSRCQPHRLRDLLLLKNLQFQNWNRRCDSNVRCFKNPSPNPKKKPCWRLNEEGPWLQGKGREDLLETSGKHHELKQAKYIFKFQKLKWLIPAIHAWYHRLRTYLLQWSKLENPEDNQREQRKRWDDCWNVGCHLIKGHAW